MEANVWRVSAGPWEARLENALLKMGVALRQWYDSEQAVGRKHSRVQALTASLWGSAAAPSCGYHGAETNGLMLFLGDMLRQNAAMIPDFARVEAYWRSAAELYRLIRENPVVFTDGVSQDMKKGVPGNPQIFVIGSDRDWAVSTPTRGGAL